MAIVVDDLILEALRGVLWLNRRRKLLGDVVLNTAIRARRHLPLPGELEVAVRGLCHEVSALERLTIGLHGHLTAGDLLDRAVHDDPMRGRDVGVAEPAPSLQRLSVEE